MMYRRLYIYVLALSVSDGLRLLELTDKEQQWYLEQPCFTMEACKRLQRQVHDFSALVK